MTYSLPTVSITPENAAQYGFSPEAVAMFEDKIQAIRAKIKYYTDASELEQYAGNGNVDAQYLLGLEYEKSKSGVVQARYWYEKAAEQHNAAAAFALYFRLKRRRSEFLCTIWNAVNIEQPLAAQQPFAGFYAAQTLDFLTGGVLSEAEKEKQNIYCSIANYHTLLYALAGDAEAQKLIAYMRQQGFGGKKDPREAEKWLNIIGTPFFFPAQ